MRGPDERDLGEIPAHARDVGNCADLLVQLGLGRDDFTRVHDGHAM